MRKAFFLIIICIFFQADAKKSFVIFPLENKTNDKLVDWVGYSIPELFFRTMSELPEIQVWDPVFIFNVDSSAWRLDSDSLLLIHQERWEWDAAIGGSYKANDDSVWLTLKVVRRNNNKIVLKKKEVLIETKFYLNTCASLLQDILAFLKVEVPSIAKKGMKRSAVKNLNVYATYATGYGYEMLGKTNYAISVYKRVIDMTESFAPAYYRLGMLYSRSRNRKEAMEYLERAASRSHNSSLMVSAIAEFLLRSDEQDKALSYINSKRDMLEKTVAGMKVIGLSYVLSGEYQRAVSVLTRAVAEGPSDLEIDFLLGSVYLKLGRFSTSVDIFRRLVRYRPQYIRYYSFLGEAYREAGNYMESCKVLQNAMKLGPDNVPNLISLSNTYLNLGWYKKAEQYLLRAKDLNPDISEIFLNLGVLYWHMKKKKEANRMFDIASKDQFNAQSALNNQANILFLSGNLKAAIKAYKRADKFGRKSETILYNLALAYLSAGKTKEAEACFDEVLMLSPDRIDILIKQAQLAFARKDDEKAERYYRKILELSPGNREVMVKLIGLFEAGERYKDAMQVVEGYLNDFPQDHEYRLKLPDMYRKMGWYEVAIEQYKNLQNEDYYKNSFAVYLGLGMSMYDMIQYKNDRDYEKTIYILKKAAQLNPSNPEPDIIIGSIYMDYKRYRELAMEHWQKAYKNSRSPQEKQMISDLLQGVKK